MSINPTHTGKSEHIFRRIYRWSKGWAVLLGVVSYIVVILYGVLWLLTWVGVMDFVLEIMKAPPYTIEWWQNTF